MADKIFRNYLNFFEDQLVDVEISTKLDTDSKIRGKLRIGKNNYPRLSVNEFLSIKHIRDQKNIKCHCDSFNYLLVNCEFDGFECVPQYVVRSTSKPTNKFKNVQILFKGISEWIIGSKPIAWDDERSAFNYSRESKRFDVELDDGQSKRFRLHNEYWFSSGNSIAGIDVREYCLISMENKSGYWSAQQLHEKIRDIRRVLSTLTGLTVDIQCVIEASNSDEKSIYFLSGQGNGSIDDYYNQCFYPSTYLFQENRLENIFSTYFSSAKERFDKVWVRLNGLLDYTGFWDYKILGAVSFLDKVASDHSKNISRSISSSKMSRIRKHTRDIIDEISSEELKDNPEQQVVYDNIKKQLPEIENTSISTFEDKYRCLMQELSQNLRQIIDIRDTDFAHLKKIRNYIAHGEKAPLKIDNNITYEMILVNKIIILLLYFAHKDLGLSERDFLRMLEVSRSQFVLKARLDRAALSANLQTAFKLPVKKTAFDNIKKKKLDYLVLKYIPSSDTYSLDIKLSTALVENFYSAKPKRKNTRSVENELSKIVPPASIKSISYVSRINITHNEKMYYLNKSVLLLNAPSTAFEGYSLNIRTIVYDLNSRKWV